MIDAVRRHYYKSVSFGKFDDCEEKTIRFSKSNECNLLYECSTNAQLLNTLIPYVLQVPFRLTNICFLTNYAINFIDDVGYL